MTITATHTRKDLVGNGATDTFPFDFEVLASSDLMVYVAGVLKTSGIHYTVTGTFPGTGSVVFTAGNIPALNAAVIIEGNTPLTQQTDLTAAQRYSEDLVEGMADKATILLQQIKNRALLLPLGAPVAGPVSMGNQVALGYLRYNLTRTGIEAVPFSGAPSTAAEDIVGIFPNLTSKEPWTDVRAFGAVGDGVTDDTAAIQAAVDYVALLGGGIVFFPRGTYEATYIDLPSNVQIVGVGWASVIHSIAGTIARPQPGTETDGLITVNYLNSATPTKNVVIRDIQLKQDIQAGAYTSPPDEFYHLICVGHAENVVVERVFFNGWRGDAIFLGGQLYAGAPADHVCRNASVRDCYFDGLTNNTRQAISLLSVDGVLIDGNFFTRTTGPNPGAIDLEPELVTDFARDITISNNFFSEIGAVGARKPAFVVDFGNLDGTNWDRRGRIAFVNNTVIDALGMYIMGNATVTDEPQVFTIKGNYFRGCEKFLFTQVNGLIVEGNVFDGTNDSMVFGYDVGAHWASHIKVRDNVFNNCGKLASALAVTYVVDMEIAGNTFKDCGYAAGGASAIAIALQSNGSSSLLQIHNNVFRAPDGVTATSLNVAAPHTQDALSVFRDNMLADGIAAPTNWAGAPLGVVPSPILTGDVKGITADKTFANVDQTNVGIFSVGGGQNGGVVSLLDNQSITVTLGNYSGLISIGNNHTGNAALFHVSMTSATITALADVGTEWVLTDVDSSKLAIFKGAGSNVITIKNYANATRSLTINILGATVASSTAPA